MSPCISMSASLEHLPLSSQMPNAPMDGSEKIVNGEEGEEDELFTASPCLETACLSLPPPHTPPLFQRVRVAGCWREIGGGEESLPARQGKAGARTGLPGHKACGMQEGSE